MRKNFALGVFLLAASFAFTEPASIGLLASWSPVVAHDQTYLDATDTRVSLDTTYADLGARVFLDSGNFEASFGYHIAVTKENFKISAHGMSVSTDVDFALTAIDVQLVAKYPIHSGYFTLSPLAGVEKDFCLSGSLAGMPLSGDDIVPSAPGGALAGIEGDFKISYEMFLRVQFIMAYDFTSNYVGSSGFKAQLAVGIGAAL